MENGRRIRIGQLILVPALISLCITLLRLSGELRGWSPVWFSKDTGGAIPSGFSWVIGITWLALPFGAWFGWRLIKAGIAPAHPLRSLIIALAATLLFYTGLRLVRLVFPLSFPPILIPIWSVALVGAAIAWFAWPALAKVNAFYAFAARIPVALVMFFAMLGKWGTHYDYTGMPTQFQMLFWPGFFWLAFFPQLIFWVGYTVIIGTLGGSFVASLLARRAGTSGS